MPSSWARPPCPWDPWDPWDGPREVFREPYDFDGPTGYAAAESVGDGCPMLPQLVPEFFCDFCREFREFDRTAIASAPVNMFAWAPSEGGCLVLGS